VLPITVVTLVAMVIRGQDRDGSPGDTPPR
jgi:hypothetical protein